MKSLHVNMEARRRFRSWSLAGVSGWVVLGGMAAGAPPPAARFGEETLGLFSVATSRYFLNGTINVPVKEVDAQLVRAGKTDDELLKAAAGSCSDLRNNQQQQVVQAKKLGLPVKEEEGAPAKTPTLADVAAEADGPPDQAMFNEGTELLVQAHRMSRELRTKVAAICKRDQPKVPPIAAPLEITFASPGCLQIVNTSTATLHHCVITTSSTMFPDLQIYREPGTEAPPLTGSKEKRRIDSGRALQLGQQAMRDERGFFTYVAELRGGEVLKVPFCDLRSLTGVKEVRMSFWSDESSSENATVRGLLEYRQQVYEEAKLWKEGHKEERTMHWDDPLTTNEKLGMPQSYSRDAKGTKLDHQPETSGWQ